MEHGLLVNFGSYRFQIKKYAMTSGSGDKRGGSGNFLSSFLFAPFAFLCGKLLSWSRRQPPWQRQGSPTLLEA